MRTLSCIALCLLMLALCAPAQAAAKKEARKPAAPESMETVQTKLDVVGKKLVESAARTVTPPKNAKAVQPDGKEFVASYVEVDTQSLKTEVRPSTGPGGQYVGLIKYLENHYECRAASKAEALNAPCTLVKARRMNELIRYDGGKWSY